jgi:hypothetical protein
VNDVKQKLIDDPDFVFLRRFDYSMKKVLERYPDGLPEKLISQALMLSEEEVEALYQETLSFFRKEMKVEAQ